MLKISKAAPLTGAKRAGKIISILAITGALALGTVTTPAYACVEAENIIGEEQTTEDRSNIKLTEAREVNDYFTGYDAYGDHNVCSEQISKAIELSNILNAYNNYDAYAYSNTTKAEVLSLDIDTMYDEYLADAQYGYRNFCAKYISSKPAIDAYLEFSCGTITTSIAENIQSALYTSLVNQGLTNVEWPELKNVDGTLYGVVKINGWTSLIKIDTTNIEEVKTACNDLATRYNTCIQNVAGVSDTYVNCFAYNGIDTVTGESAWLSLADDELKTELTSSMEIANNFQNEITMDVNNTGLFVYDKKDIKALRKLGYTDDQIRNITVMDATVSMDYRLEK